MKPFWSAGLLLALLWSGLSVAADSPEEPVKVLRQAAVAGSWYPADPEELKAYLDQALSRLPVGSESAQIPVRALLVPHSEVRHSGAIAAQGFHRVRGAHFGRVVVLGPAHRGQFEGLAVPDATHYATPLGEIPLDPEAVRRLLSSGAARKIPGVDRRENVIEMPLPWLQHLLKPDWKLVPILVGILNAESSGQAAQALRPLLGEDTLLVISGEFTHYGPAYDYLPFPAKDPRFFERLRRLDLGLWERLVARDVSGLFAYREQTGNNACALGPLAILGHLLTPATTITLEGYATSAPLGKQGNSVSYLAASFGDAAPWSAGSEAKPVASGSATDR
ncbi:MAG: AmmeMemoRadiSam system protein B [Magnetococcales bacterium]|nr:AmmeMemoRadiSam system protein B [Magnetococcales bacterium]